MAARFALALRDRREIVKLIDELGAGEERMRDAKKFVDQYDKKKKVLIEKIVTLYGVEPEKEHDEKGRVYTAKITSCAEKREIKNKKRLMDILPLDLFLKLYNINLGDIDKHLTDAEKAEVIESSKTGGRKITFTKN